MSELNKIIESNRKEVNKKIFRERVSYPRVKTNKYRTRDEREALTAIIKLSFERAKKEGKWKVIKNNEGKRKIYYDSSDD